MAEQTISLEPGETKLVTFEAVPYEARIYQVNVNGLAGSFNVVTPPPTESSLVGLNVPPVPSGASFWPEATLFLPPIEAGRYTFDLRVDPKYFPTLAHRTGLITSNAPMMQHEFRNTPQRVYPEWHVLDSPDNLYTIRGWRFAMGKAERDSYGDSYLVPSRAIYYEPRPGAFGGVSYVQKPIPPGLYDLLAKIEWSRTYPSEKKEWDLGVVGQLEVT